MFMRLIEFKFSQNSSKELIAQFEDEILGDLKNQSGCMYGGLINNNLNPNIFGIITFWKTRQAAEDFGRGELIFADLEKYVSERKEWKPQLSKDLVLEYFPVEEKEDINLFRLTKNSSRSLDKLEIPNLFIRLVSVKVEKDKFDEFKRIYENEIIPELESIPGCYSAYMLENIDSVNNIILLNVWQNRALAEKYEEGKLFKKHFQKVEHTFSQLYQWKLVLEESYNGKIKTSDDLQITHYTLVTGKLLGKENA